MGLTKHTFSGIGKIFYKLGPKFGFIIPMSNIGINYKASDNVYFNVEAYRLGMNKKVVDLTKELEISEVVSFVLCYRGLILFF